MTINEETRGDSESVVPPYKQVIAGTLAMTGGMADELIVALIDHSDDARVAEELGMTVEDLCAYTQQFEEQIRHRVRNLR